MIRRLLSVLAAAVAVTALSAGSARADDPPPPAGTPTAISFGGVPYAGAIFDNGLGQAHSCSGSVVRSPRRDLVITAAHCVSGTGAGLLFAPGYVDGRTPYGVWTVTRAWVSPAWTRSQDPHDDYAFLEVARAHDGTRLEDVTGGSVLGAAVPAGTAVTDIAYPYGLDDQPITCTTKVVYTAEYPTFNCYGYPGGTSGSPFLIAPAHGPTVVVGLIGGLHQGGCYEWNSFSSPFGLRTYLTYLRAALGLRADVVPEAGSDGC